MDRRSAFFFSSRRRHTRSLRDWSSDVCSSDLGKVLAAASLPAPKHGTAMSFDEAQLIATEIGYPVLVRPSYVLGGRGMEIVYSEAELTAALDRLSAGQGSWEHPVLIDRFLDDAVEIDVDGLFDGDEL